MAIREPIYLAIFNLASTIANFNTKSRIWKPIVACQDGNFPCLFQVQLGEDFEQVKGLPAKNTLHVDLHLYAQTESIKDDNSVAPAIQLNNMLDALETALAPDPATGVQTLGGLVSHCWISGRTLTDEGTLGEKAMLVVGIDALITAPTPNQYMFDSGWLFMKDLNNANATPVMIGTLQSIEASVTFDKMEERGNFQHPIVVARKAASIKGKAKFAQIKGAVFSQILFGQAPATGSLKVLPAVSYTIPANPGPYTVTPAVAGGTFSADLGVSYDTSATSAALVYVTGAPAAGQYSVSAGVYTFHSSDAGKVVKISCVASVSSGNQLALSNSFSTYTPIFEVYLNNSSLDGKQATWKLNACSSDQLQFITQLEDFTIPEFSFTAKADAANAIGNFSYSQ